MTRIALAYVHDDNCLAHRVIRAVTGGPGHVVVLVNRDFGLGIPETRYYESIFKRDRITGKTGVRGPIPIQNLLEWVAEGNGSRTIRYQPRAGEWLPLTEIEAMKTEALLVWARPEIRYAAVQLYRHLVQRIVPGRPWIHWMLGSRTAWTCSETAFVCAIPPRAWPHFNVPYVLADQIVPGGESYWSLAAGVRKWIDHEKGKKTSGPIPDIRATG